MTHQFDSQLPSVSVVVAVFNEVEHFDTALATVLAQRYAGPLEYIFVDGGSTDGTLELLEALVELRDDVAVLRNSRPGIAISLNIALEQAVGDVLVRMDAHTSYADSYVECGVAALVAGKAEWAAGPAIAAGSGDWSRWVAAALASKLGVGGADFRRSTQEHLTDAGFGGAVARRDLEQLGGWDESWEVNEDGELAARAARAGWRILLVPEMAARYIPRDDLNGLAKQYWRYGLWRAKTSVVYPESVRPSHALPPMLALTLLVACLPLVGRLARIAVVVYLAVIGGAGIAIAQRQGQLSAAPKVSAVLATMHTSWGFASLAGFKRFGSPLPALLVLVATLRQRLSA